LLVILISRLGIAVGDFADNEWGIHHNRRKLDRIFIGKGWS